MAQEIKKQEPGGAAAQRYRDPFAEMRSEMDRVFDAFLGRSLFGRPALFGSTEALTALAPDIDIRENEKEMLLPRLCWIAHERRRDLARFDGSRDRASMMFQPCFLAVETKERISAKSIAPCNDRKPPEIFCRSFIMRPSRSA